MVQEVKFPFHEELQCFVDGLAYDFKTRTGFITIGKSNCTDMCGAIAIMTRIDPAVLKIYTVSDELVVYRRTSVDSTWVARVYRSEGVVMPPSKWDWAVRGYASNNHPMCPKVKYGDLLVATTHKGVVSKDMAVAAWRSRMARGEVAYIEVINLQTNEMETLYE